MQTKTRFQDETKINNTKWLQAWFKDQCNGDREHSHGISINTLDNPGWKIEISLSDTDFENLKLDFIKIDISEEDWYTFGVKDETFIGVGDTSKLEFLIGKFRELVTK